MTRCGAFAAPEERSNALDLPVVAGEQVRADGGGTEFVAPGERSNEVDGQQVDADEGGIKTLHGGLGWAYR